MIYSAYNLNKQGNNIQAWHIPFPIWNQSVVPCPVLTVASWPAYRFLRWQVRWSSIPISLRIFHSCFLGSEFYRAENMGAQNIWFGINIRTQMNRIYLCLFFSLVYMFSTIFPHDVKSRCVKVIWLATLVPSVLVMTSKWVRWSVCVFQMLSCVQCFVIPWTRVSLWLCGSQQTVENSERDGNIRPPDLPLEKPVCRSKNNS